jgi:hypothetical protein
MRGGARNGAGRPKGTRNLETMVKDAKRIGVDEDQCPSLAYLRRIVTNQIKNPSQQKIEAAKALLAYEAPRWGERTPEPEQKSEEEMLAELKGLAANAEIVEFFLGAVMGSKTGQESVFQVLGRLGYQLSRPEGAEIVQLRPASA